MTTEQKTKMLAEMRGFEWDEERRCWDHSERDECVFGYLPYSNYTDCMETLIEFAKTRIVALSILPDGRMEGAKKFDCEYAINQDQYISAEDDNLCVAVCDCMVETLIKEKESMDDVPQLTDKDGGAE